MMAAHMPSARRGGAGARWRVAMALAGWRGAQRVVYARAEKEQRVKKTPP